MGEKFRTLKKKVAFIFSSLFVSDDPEDEGTRILLQYINL